MRTATLYRMLAALMVLMAAALVLTHTTALGTLSLPGPARAIAGVAAGFGIGVVAAIMGVASGELLIPTIVLLYSVDIKAAGSLSLLVSLPTMLVAFARYSRDGSFAVLGANLRFVAVMVAGSITGALLGGLLLGVIPDLVLIPILAIVLLISAQDGPPQLTSSTPAASPIRESGAATSHRHPEPDQPPSAVRTDQQTLLLVTSKITLE